MKLSAKKSECSILHVLVSLRAEGTPRLALELLREEKRLTGQTGQVAFLHPHLRDLEPRFQELGVPLHEMPWKRRRFDRLFFQSLRLLKHLRPRGVICYPLGAHVPVATAAKVLGIPCVVHVGNTPPEHSPRAVQIIRTQMLLGLPVTRLYVCCSDCVRNAICKHYTLPRRKTVRIYNGIQLEKFLAVRSLRRPGVDGILRIGMVASLEPSKDHATLLKAIAVLKHQGQTVCLRLLGAGSLMASLQAMASELSIQDCVEFPGMVVDVASELAAMDVFAFSATPDEGMGIALVEAMAAGLPCVGSNVVACNEVLQQGKLGTIVPKQGPQLWAQALVAARNREPIPEAELLPYRIGTTYEEYTRALFAPWPPIPERF